MTNLIAGVIVILSTNVFDSDHPSGDGSVNRQTVVEAFVSATMVIYGVNVFTTNVFPLTITQQKLALPTRQPREPLGVRDVPQPPVIPQIRTNALTREREFFLEDPPVDFTHPAYDPSPLFEGPSETPLTTETP